MRKSAKRAAGSHFLSNIEVKAIKTAFLFSGQGAQYSGMMRDIAERHTAAKEVFDIADKTLGRSIGKLCFEGAQDDLNLTHNTQPCVLAADLAAYKALEASGITPEAVAGFSLGEYAALVAAGVIDMNDVFSLIQKRADLMQDAVPIGKGAMAAVMKLPAGEVRALCEEVEGYVVPANYNCPGQTVVSGEADAVDRLCELAREKKIRAMKLPVSAPFHCDMMRPAAENLKEPLRKTLFSPPGIPVYMNVDAGRETNPDIIREKLIAQTRSPVRWEETLRNMAGDGVDTFIEVGPGKTLSGFVKKTLKDGVQVFNVTDADTLDAVIGAWRE